MTELKPVIIKEDSTGKTFLFDNDTSFKIIYGPWGKDKFHLHSPTIELFADNKQFSPIEVYKDKDQTEYVISLHFDKAFPLIHRDNPTSVIWSAFLFKESSLGAERNLRWLNDGKEAVELKRKLIPMISEKLWYKGDTATNQLELFASMLYVYFAYQPNNT